MATTNVPYHLFVIYSMIMAENIPEPKIAGTAAARHSNIKNVAEDGLSFYLNLLAASVKVGLNGMLLNTKTKTIIGLVMKGWNRIPNQTTKEIQKLSPQLLMNQGLIHLR